jgi:hypothetical protein
MNWKGFLKPDWIKIMIMVMVYLTIPWPFFLGDYYTCPKERYCSGEIYVAGPLILNITYFILNFYLADIIRETGLLFGYLIVSFFISCLLVWLITKIKFFKYTKKKMILTIIIFLIFGVILNLILYNITLCTPSMFARDISEGSTPCIYEYDRLVLFTWGSFNFPSFITEFLGWKIIPSLDFAIQFLILSISWMVSLLWAYIISSLLVFIYNKLKDIKSKSKRLFWILITLIIILPLIYFIFIFGDWCKYLNNDSVSCNKIPFCEWTATVSGKWNEYECCYRLPHKFERSWEPYGTIYERSYIPDWWIYYPARCQLMLVD